MERNMGSMKRKRRKKQAAEWAGFQQEHQLADEEVQLARGMGYPLATLEEKLADRPLAPEASTTADRIREIHRRWKEGLEARQAAVEAGLIAPPAKKKKKAQHDPEWAMAKRLCRLNTDDVRKAKEMGLNPRKLVKNIPSPSEPWKLPVSIWIRELYEEMQAKAR
jgi:hypothetical protein